MCGLVIGQISLGEDIANIKILLSECICADKIAEVATHGFRFPSFEVDVQRAYPKVGLLMI